MTTNPRLVATDCLDAVKRAEAVKVLVVKAFMVKRARGAECSNGARPRPRPREIRCGSRGFVYGRKYIRYTIRGSENYLSMPA